MSSLTPNQVAAWLREQSRKYAEMADMISGDAQAVTAPLHARAKAVSPQLAQAIAAPSPDDIKKQIRIKGMRTPALAAHFQTDIQSIKTLITPENGLWIVNGGWVAERDPDADVV